MDVKEKYQLFASHTHLNQGLNLLHRHAPQLEMELVTLGLAG